AEEPGDGVSSGEPRGCGGHLELEVCPQKSHQGVDVGVLEHVGVSVEDVSKLGFDRVDEIVFGKVAALELAARASQSAVDRVAGDLARCDASIVCWSVMAATDCGGWTDP